MRLLDVLSSLSGRPSPPSRPHLVRRVYGRVLHAAASLPLVVLQPGDVRAATEVRAGLLNADVPSASDAGAYCIQHTVADLGPADLWTLAHGTTMTRDDLARGRHRNSGARTPRPAGSPAARAEARPSTIAPVLPGQRAATLSVTPVSGTASASGWRGAVFLGPRRATWTSRAAMTAAPTAPGADARLRPVAAAPVGGQCRAAAVRRVPALRRRQPRRRATTPHLPGPPRARRPHRPRRTPPPRLPATRPGGHGPHEAAAAGLLRARRRRRRGRAPDTTRGGTLVASALSAGGMPRLTQASLPWAGGGTRPHTYVASVSRAAVAA